MKLPEKLPDIRIVGLSIFNIKRIPTCANLYDADWFGEQEKIENALAGTNLEISQSEGIKGVYNNRGNCAGENAIEGTLHLEFKSKP